MAKVKFNFFHDDKDTWLGSFCKYFQLDESVAFSYFNKANPDELTPDKVGNDLNLSQYDSSTVNIICRHMTTTIADNLSSFLSLGILDLKSMLQLDTPINRFLDNNGINVNVDAKKVTINSSEYPITSQDEVCLKCMKNKETICNEYMRCELRKSLDKLGLKLYKYGGTLEFFIHASYEQMSLYSNIRLCPEILQTIDRIVEIATGQNAISELSYKWIKSRKKCYVLEFPAKLSDMEFVAIDYNARFASIASCILKSGYDYCDYMEKKIPFRVFENIGLIQWFLSVYFYDSELLGSLLPNKTVSPDLIKIIEVKI